MAVLKVTAKEVAEHLGVDYVVAAGLMSRFLELGFAKHVENRKSANGKGKPTRVFEVERTITLELAPASQTVELPQDNSTESEAA